MTIIVDTRQKEDKHKVKHSQMIDAGAKLIRSKLPIGDYALLTDLSTVIDTKQDMKEVYSNIISDHARFVSEIKKAMDNDIRLIFLVEHGDDIKYIDDVENWVNPQVEKYKSRIRKILLGEGALLKWGTYTIEEMVASAKENKIKIPRPPVSSMQLANAMRTLQERYCCLFLFCTKEECGNRIIALLGGD